MIKSQQFNHQETNKENIKTKNSLHVCAPAPLFANYCVT